MQAQIVLAILALIAASPALARKDCEDLKREIATKIDAKGVKSYALEIVAADAATSGKIVGNCNGGTQRIAYERRTVTAASTEIAAEPAD